MQVPLPPPVHFWDTQAFSNSILALLALLVVWLTSKVSKVEKNTDGINSFLQKKVDTQATDATHLAEITDKDKQIAKLTKES
jgi:hypothetical protein